MLAGDATNDNIINTIDFGLLVGCYGSAADIAGSGYDIRCDFNCDGSVDTTDFGLISGNYGAQGANQPAGGPVLRDSVIWDFPAPDYGAEVVPMDGGSAGGAVNLTSGVYENHPGADLDAFNPVGPDPAYVRTYHSGRASQGYSSPGLSLGWIDNYDYTIFAPPLGGGYGPLALIYPNGAVDILTTPRQPVAITNAATTLSGGACVLNPPAQVPYFVTGNLGATAGVWSNLYITFADNRQMVFTPVGGGLYRYTALVDLKHPVGTIGRTLFINRNSTGSVDSIVNDDTRVAPAIRTLLQFQYGGGTSLSSVTDVQGGRIVRYGWNQGLLHTVYQIAATAAPAGGASLLWQYDYDTVNTAWTLLKTITVPSAMPNPLPLPQILLTYDAGGRVQQISDQNGYTRQYTYNPNAAAGQTRVTVPTDAADITKFQQWTQTFARNRDTGTLQAYTGATGLATSLATSLNYTESNPYLITVATDPNGAETHYAYDALGNLASVTEPILGGAVTTTYKYNTTVAINPLGWLTEIDTSSTAQGGATKTPTTFDYYTIVQSDMTGVIGLPGQIQALHTPKPGLINPGSWVDATFTYTALGNLASVTSPGPNNAGTVTTTFGYTADALDAALNFNDNVANANEALGEPVAVISPFETAANANATRTQHYRYDALGNLSRSYSALGQKTSYLYNIANQPRYTAFPVVHQGGQATTELVAGVAYAYIGGPARSATYYNVPLIQDGQGNLTLLPLPPYADALILRQVATEYGKAEEINKLTGSTLPLNFTYDRAYQLTGLSYDSGVHKSQFRYDNGGNLFQHQWPGGKTASATYDATGSLDTVTTPRGATATLRYAPNHLAVTQITHTTPQGIAAVPNTDYLYDAFGRVSDISDNTTEFAYTYDDNDNVLSVVTKYKAAAGSGLSCPLPQEVDYTYNTDGTIGRTQWSELPQDRAGLGAASGVRLAGFAPNAKKQASGTPVTSIRDWMSKGCFPKTQDQTVFRSKTAPDWDPLHLNAKDTYDADGHLTNQTDDASSTDYSDGDACLPASETNTASDCVPFVDPFPCYTVALPLRTPLSLPQYKNFTYDPLHHLTGYQADYDGGFANLGETATTTYIYDNRDRLTSEGCVIKTKDDNNPGRIKSTEGYGASYTPDAADNLTNIRAAQPAFTYNADNQITNTGYVYDDDGDLTALRAAPNDPNTTTLTYDAAGRLTSYTYRTPTVANPLISLTFGYRPDGLRAWKQNGSVRTYYFYNGSRLQYEMTQVAGGTWAMTRCLAWGANGIYESWNVSDGGVAYLYDPQGNVVSRYTQASGQWDGTRVYDAYGKSRSVTAGANLSDPVGYNGQWGYYTDVTSGVAAGNGTQAGLILCGHRYYSPDLCRWLTRDPLGYDGGINVYAYCGDNPVGSIDPSGFDRHLPTEGEKNALQNAINIIRRVGEKTHSKEWIDAADYLQRRLEYKHLYVDDTMGEGGLTNIFDEITVNAQFIDGSYGDTGPFRLVSTLIHEHEHTFQNPFARGYAATFNWSAWDVDTYDASLRFLQDWLSMTTNSTKRSLISQTIDDVKGDRDACMKGSNK